MLRRRFTSDAQPRTKNGQPPQSTTGVASASWSQHAGAAMRRAAPDISAIASAKSGSVSTALTAKRRLMSTSSALSSSSAPSSIGSSAMPQIGQLPGASRTISGCIGQVQRRPGSTFTGVCGARNAAGSARKRSRQRRPQKR